MDCGSLVRGDFNDIMSVFEKMGGKLVSFEKCEVFKNIVYLCKLVDLGYVGHKYTWRDPIYYGGSRTYKRLSRGLYNKNWRVQFPDAIVKVLTQL